MFTQSYQMHPYSNIFPSPNPVYRVPGPILNQSVIQAKLTVSQPPLIRSVKTQQHTPNKYQTPTKQNYQKKTDIEYDEQEISQIISKYIGNQRNKATAITTIYHQQENLKLSQESQQENIYQQYLSTFAKAHNLSSEKKRPNSSEKNDNLSEKENQSIVHSFIANNQETAQSQNDHESLKKRLNEIFDEFKQIQQILPGTQQHKEEELQQRSFIQQNQNGISENSIELKEQIKQETSNNENISQVEIGNQEVKTSNDEPQKLNVEFQFEEEQQMEDVPIQEEQLKTLSQFENMLDDGFVEDHFKTQENEDCNKQEEFNFLDDIIFQKPIQFGQQIQLRNDLSIIEEEEELKQFESEQKLQQDIMFEESQIQEKEKDSQQEQQEVINKLNSMLSEINNKIKNSQKQTKQNINQQSIQEQNEIQKKKMEEFRILQQQKIEMIRVKYEAKKTQEEEYKDFDFPQQDNQDVSTQPIASKVLNNQKIQPNQIKYGLIGLLVITILTQLITLIFK